MESIILIGAEDDQPAVVCGDLTGVADCRADIVQFEARIVFDDSPGC